MSPFRREGGGRGEGGGEGGREGGGRKEKYFVQ